MAETCIICKRNVVQPYTRDKAGAYCSPECFEVRSHPGFCERCLQQTERRGAGNLTRAFGIGPWFFGGSDPCSTCKSVVRRVWFCVLFAPVIPLQRYRVIPFGGGRYLCRRLRSGA